ncbi:MAG TPA: hypothetical protein VF941_14670 [Clostridia bacterium]
MEQRWTRLDKEIDKKGTYSFEHKSLQCKQCTHKLQNPMVCTEYPERKPNCVLKIECDCPKFEPKE